MAVSHSDIPHFNTKSNHRGCESAKNETGVTNISDPSWHKDVKSTHNSLWPQFPPPDSLPPAEEDDWSSYSQNECNPPPATTVLSTSWPNHLPVSFTQARDMPTEHDKLGEGDTKTADPSVQSLAYAPTSRPRSPSFQQRPVVADCKPADSEGLHTTTVLPGTRSPTVGSESRSSRSDNPTCRSLEHLTVMHDTGSMDKPSFPPVLSKSFGASCVGDMGGDGLPSKRALSAYYGVQTSVKQHPIDADEHCGALWSQQHMWSKSAPQHLHGMDLPATYAPSSLDAGPSCSVPDSGHPSLGPLDPLGAFDTPTSGHIEQSFDPTGYFPASVRQMQQPAPITSSIVTANEHERGLHQPDGADHPDEHMWFYEDPHGRTQGSFSDAQMHDWLSEGIYFTEGLRVRRKCDDTFSTLAQYCQLFGRIPFHSGPRIPPITGGITPHPLVVTGGQADRFFQARAAAAVGSVCSSFAAPSLGPPCGYLPPPSLSSPGPAPLIAGHRSPYKLDPESGVHLPNRCGFGSSISEEDRSTSNKLTSGLYFNSNPPVGPNRFPPFPQARPPPPPPPPLVPHDLAASSLSPGFLSALAPYLAPMSGQCGLGTASSPVVSVSGTTGGIPVSSMQQLAETAQLAAQLAAMASAHSPDQTPMQPSQALALAEMLISTHLSPTNWASQFKKDGPLGTAGDFRMEQANTTSMTAVNEGLRMHSGIHPHGGGFSDDVVMKQSSLLITGSSLGTLGASDNLAAFDSDGKVSTKASRETTGNAYSKQQQQRSAEASRNNRSGQPFKSQQSMAASSGKNAGFDCNHTSTAPAPGTYTRREGQMTFADSLQRAPNPPQSMSKRLAAGGVGDLHSSSADHPQAARKMSTASKSHTSGGHGAGADSETKKRSSNKAAGGKEDRQHTAVNGPCLVDPSITPVKKGTVNHNKSGSTATTQAQCAVDKLQSPLKSQTNNQTDSSVAVTSVQTVKQLSESAEVELGLLTQWSIGRLSSLSMREKVDIPTVVELLATLDAPYEVERMVSTFLGESARATQFVKDFLDHRRPFWKLHRQLRENSIVVVGQPPSLTANHVTCVGAGHQGTSAAGTTCLSGDRTSAVGNSGGTGTSGGIASSTVNNSKKKKRPGAGGGSLATGPANHVLHHQFSGAVGDSTADNQWHHIKPKSSLYRKTNNKGGDRKPVPS